MYVHQKRFLQNEYDKRNLDNEIKYLYNLQRDDFLQEMNMKLM